MKKRGAGGTHLEFVLSFVIFVMFLIFLYGGIEPIVQTAGSKQFVLGHLKTSLVENFTLSDFTIQTFTIKIDELSESTKNQIENKECISVKGALKELAENNLTIKNSEGGIINYSESGQSLLIGSITTDDTVIKVYYASAFNQKSPELQESDCAPVNEDYEIRSVTESEIISQSNIFDICRIYDSDGGYENLKNSLGVPAGSEFSFIFRDADGFEVCPNRPLEPPQGVNVYASQIPVQYIDADATTKIGFIHLRVW